MDSKKNKKAFSAKKAIICALIFICSLPLVGIVVVFCLVAFAGKSTKEYRLCSKINEIVIDFDDPNLRGIYSQKIKGWVSSLTLSEPHQFHGCLDNLSDSLVDQCISIGGYLDFKYMKGKWKLSNKGLYTDPYGIHLNGNSKMYFVGLKKGEEVVYAPIFTFADLYPPLHGVDPDDGKSEYLQEICIQK